MHTVDVQKSCTHWIGGLSHDFIGFQPSDLGGFFPGACEEQQALTIETLLVPFILGQQWLALVDTL